jgi:hemolysin activation/secretion protein
MRRHAEHRKAHGRLPERSTAVAVLTLIASMMTGPTRAQSPTRPVPPIDRPAPTQIERRDAEERRRPLPSLPTVAPASPSTGGDARPLFRLHAVEIDGASTLSREDLASSYAGRLGQEVSQADLVAIAAAISDAYRKAGYHLSRAIVPPQDLKRGRLHITVIEGAIEEIVVKGDPAGAFGVDALLAPISAERPARLATLERQLLLANDRPGMRVTDTALDEISTASGRFRLTVTVQPWRVYTAAGVDNMGSKAVGPWQSSASAALNSLVLPGDTLAVSGSFAPGSARELRYGRVSYDAPLGIESLRGGISASHSEVWPGDARRSLRTVSRAETYEARLGFAPVLTQVHALWLTGSLGLSDVAERNGFGRLSSDRIGLASLSADYKLHAAEGSWSYLSTTWRHGLGLVDAKDDSRDWLSRAGASSRFSLLNASFTHYQNLVENWSVKLSAAGQVASGPLLTSQQYYLGGLSFGRGFEGGWLGGDNALAGSAELRFDRPLNLAFAHGYQLYGFVEGGVTRTYLQSKDLVQGLASFGVGARLFINDDLQLGVAVAKPLAYSSPLRWERGATVLFSLSNALRFCPGTQDLRCRS